MARILVVDDCQSVRTFLSDVLVDAGYEVHEADSGRKGLDEISTFRPDCVLLDILLPDMDGLDVLSEIRKQDNVLPVLLMTADDPGWARQNCEKYGATGFVSKSYNASKLLDTIEDVLLDFESRPLPKENDFV